MCDVVTVRPLREEEGPKRKEIRRAVVLCLNDLADRQLYERLVNSPTVEVEKTETHFTPEGKFYVAVFYREVEPLGPGQDVGGR